jgi:hypothetical protein
MAATYLDLLAKMQEQGLDAIKQTQKATIDTLASAREVVEKMPAMASMPAMPTIEGLPTVAELTDLNAQFMAKLLEAQQSYAKQLADVFAPIAKA